ncbi:hypothetical protein AGMMS50293_17430 [Spirochaetia bacterium]|nr:hypothetical protein AGMMS50293_17430 [Spirochaetia bacterium]
MSLAYTMTKSISKRAARIPKGDTKCLRTETFVCKNACLIFKDDVFKFEDIVIIFDDTSIQLYSISHSTIFRCCIPS